MLRRFGCLLVPPSTRACRLGLEPVRERLEEVQQVQYACHEVTPLPRALGRNPQHLYARAHAREANWPCAWRLLNRRERCRRSSERTCWSRSAGGRIRTTSASTRLASPS